MSSMLDGFCQRMNYYIAEPRTDTDMYDHFLYFAGGSHDEPGAASRNLAGLVCTGECGR